MPFRLTALLPRTRRGALVFAFLTTVAIGVVNYLGGYRVGMSAVYLVPIFVATWCAGRRAGFASALLGGWVDSVTDLWGGMQYPNRFLPVWDLLGKLAFFVAGVYVLSELRQAHEREREYARTDTLTGVANRRSFFERARLEIERAMRYARPFSVAVLDLDNFKQINDRFGHAVGDIVLRSVATAIQVNTRATDLTARFGGDEFIILLPETTADSAQALLSKLRAVLEQSMRGQNRPVTVSVGLVTFEAPPASVDDLIRRADQLMYEVKRGGKNQLKHEVVTW